jgi:hypothetical protein
MEEIWKLVAGTTYYVSNLGNIKNKNDYVLQKRLNDRGYPIISLFYEGCLHTCKIHRLVAIAFVPNPSGLLTVNHINHIKTDNNYLNLEWLSSQDNYRDAVNSSLMAHGEKHCNAILTDLDVYDIIELIREGYTDIEIASLYNIAHSSIYKIRIGYSWKHIERPIFNKTGQKKKLSATDIPDIRKMFANGAKNAAIAKIYNVNGGTISQIRQGRTWKNF